MKLKPRDPFKPKLTREQRFRMLVQYGERKLKVDDIAFAFNVSRAAVIQLAKRRGATMRRAKRAEDQAP